MKECSILLLYIYLTATWVTAQQPSRTVPAFRVPFPQNQRLNLRPPSPQPPSPVRQLNRSFHRQRFRLIKPNNNNNNTNKMTNQMNDKLIINQHIHSNQHIRTTTNNTPAAQLTHRIYHKSTSNINNRRRLVRFRNGLFRIVNNISRQRPPQSTIPTITSSQAIVQKPIRRKPLISTATVGPTMQTVILSKHQPTHQIRTNLRTKVRKNRLLNTRPSVQPTFQAALNTTTLPQTTTIISTTTIPTTIVFSPVGQVDDIEAAVLRAVIDSSTTTPIPIQPSTIRARTHRLKNSFSRSRLPLILPPLRPPPLLLPSSSPNPIDSIEAAVLQAVLTTTVPTTTVETTTIETSTVPLTTTTTTTTITTVPPTLFPAFATKRRPINVEVPITTTTVPTSLPMTTISSNQNETTLTQPITTTTVPSTTTTTLIFEETTVASTVENKPNENQVVDENLKLREIEQNVIAALTSSPIPPPTSRGPPGIAPPASLNSAGPPGSQPPSDEIVDELNVANNFMEVAQKFNLFKRLLQ